MKIGIITCWKSLDNYGQQLQCYALQTLLRGWGHDAFLIRYNPVRKERTVWQKIVNHLQHPQYFLNHLPFETEEKRRTKLELKLKKENDQKNPERQFEEFRQEHLQMTDRIYNSYTELQANPPKADVYITGSDQVWHDPYKEPSAAGWFLQFGGDNVKRLSYAASIGRNLYDNELSIFRRFLTRFDAISVREESACQLCREQGFKAQVCIDPTMLLPVETYRRMEKPVVSESPYAFIYVLNVRTAEDINWPQIKEYIGEKQLKIKSVTGSGYYQGRELIENNKNLLPTIPEWLGYVDSAQCVFTTSFHGTVFAILMHKPFLTIGLKGKYSSSNARMEQLLSALGIPERMFDRWKSVREQMDAPIHWENVDRKLEQLKSSSLDFLKKNLR